MSKGSGDLEGVLATQKPCSLTSQANTNAPAVMARAFDDVITTCGREPLRLP